MSQAISRWENECLTKRISIFAAVIAGGWEDFCADIDIC
jgi:hypothetical protein